MYYLNINSIANFIDFHICRQWNDSMSAELSGKQIPSTMPITFRIGHIWCSICNMKMCLEKYKQNKNDN